MNKDENKISRISGLITIGIFLLVVMGFFVATIIKPDKSFSDNENRVLAERPEFSLKNLFEGDFTTEYETYITDQFIARDNFIAVKVTTDRALGRQVVNGVYFAPNNHLIEEHKADDVDTKLVQSNIDWVKEFVETNKEQIDVKLMLVPTISNVYPEWLPSYNLEYDQSALIKQAIATVGMDHTIDASDILKQHKDEDLYFKTDHHWTSLGAYYGYTAWADKNGLTPHSLNQYDRTVVTKDFWGTTYSKVNIKKEADEIELFSLKNGKALTMSVKQDGSEATDSLYKIEQLKVKDKFTVFLGGNNPYVEINTSVKNGKTLLLVKDSYAHNMVPFLTNDYEKIILLDYRYYNNSTKELMQDKQVTDVLLLYNVINFVTDKNLIKLNK